MTMISMADAEYLLQDVDMSGRTIRDLITGGIPDYVTGIQYNSDGQPTSVCGVVGDGDSALLIINYDVKGKHMTLFQYSDWIDAPAELMVHVFGELKNLQTYCQVKLLNEYQKELFAEAV